MQTKRELRDLLLDAIEQVKDGTLEPAKASAVADLSQAVINADRFQLEVMAFAVEHRDQVTLANGRALALTHDKPDGEPPDDEDDSEEEIEDEEEDEPAPTPKQPPPKTAHVSMVRALLKSDQPLELADIASTTKIPQADLFKILADEKLFERDTDGFYWLAK